MHSCIKLKNAILYLPKKSDTKVQKSECNFVSTKKIRYKSAETRMQFCIYSKKLDTKVQNLRSTGYKSAKLRPCSNSVVKKNGMRTYPLLFSEKWSFAY